MEKLVTNCDRFTMLKHSSVPTSAKMGKHQAGLSLLIKTEIWYNVRHDGQ